MHIIKSGSKVKVIDKVSVINKRIPSYISINPIIDTISITPKDKNKNM